MKAGYFQENQAASCKKWRSSYLSVQNACIRIMDRPIKNPNSSSSVDMDDCPIVDARKIFFEAKIEECLVYYGLYEDNLTSSSTLNVLDTSLSSSHSQSILDVSSLLSSDNRPSSFIRKLLNSAAGSSNASSSVRRVSTSSSSYSLGNVIVNRENCLTFYHLIDKSIISVFLDSKSNALNRYASLFKLANYPDTWSVSL